jgi:hypothetical protein
LSGYDTSFQGEILVSTFTAGMHKREGMAGHILPVILQWHLGIKLVDVGIAHKGALDPAKFWTARERGAETAGDPFARRWDFWAEAERPLAELKTAYGVPPLDPAMAAVGDGLTAAFKHDKTDAS